MEFLQRPLLTPHFPVYPWRHRAKRLVRFDDLRHTFATRVVQAGEDIYTVQKLRRWKNISMVLRYAHHYPESLRSGIEVLDKLRESHLTILSQSKEKGVTTESQPLDLIGSGVRI